MNLEEFETRYRYEMNKSLSQIQIMVLLIAQLEASIATVGKNLQVLSQTVEEFIRERRPE